MIDAHVHVVPPNLPGVGSLSPLLDQPLEAVAAKLRAEMDAAGMTHALAMGRWRPPEDDPLAIEATLRVARHVPGLYAIGMADPGISDPEHLRRVDVALAEAKVVALKGYLGYLHYGPDHPGYVPYYELAAKHGVPFVFHTGDTYSPKAKLRYAQPLLVDDVAVDHPRVRFVMAHLGNPWLLDAAEVIYKNVNVWADLSGMLVGDAASFADEEHREAIADTVAGVRKAFRYAERPNRFLYGSDWPLAPMREYRNFVRSAIPEQYHEQVFEENARKLFRL
jgi:uncharacterized protein